MLFLGAIFAIALMLGWGLGGGLRALADVRIRLWPAIPVAVLLQVVPVPEVSGGVGRLLPVGFLLTSYLLLAVVAVANWYQRGFPLILLGLLLNGTVVTINQGMPVSEQAIRDSGNLSLLEDLPRERGGKHHAATDEDVLVFLADSVPVREPFGVVVSPGDAAIDVGAAVFLAAAMLRRQDRRHREEEEWPSLRTQPSGTRR
ncbi:MAG: DUF5317 family protein [Actinomycetota bacterium]